MATYCPICEQLVKDGEKVKVMIYGTYRQATEMTHTIEAELEEWVEHLVC